MSPASSGPNPSSGPWARWRRLFSSRRMSSVPTGPENRTGAELSRCLAGLTGMGSIGNKDKARQGTLTLQQQPPTTPQHHLHNPIPIPHENGAQNPRNNRRPPMLLAMIGRPVTLNELWQDERFLTNFFQYCSTGERRILAQVCLRWRDVIYQQRFWIGALPVLRCRELRGCATVRRRLYASMQRRGFDAICLVGANDDDAADLLNNYPPCTRNVRRLALRCSSVSDKGLENLLEHMQAVSHLELAGCNEITEAGLWACLTPRLVALSIADCINVADESVGAVAQLLPALKEFSLQAYHVTDAALGYFSAKQAASLAVLRLHSCWEVTNHGLVNVVHALPNLSVLSLSGCSKITDDGVELIAENLRGLRSLDLSWCPRITDAALEYIACDLAHLEDLTLDRCVHITDIGVGYVSTMLSLSSLFLRWCSQIRDFGLQHLCSMRNLRVLSLAGCSLLTSSGLSSLIQLRHLQELELTNCPGASRELFDYLHEHLPHCLIVE